MNNQNKWGEPVPVAIVSCSSYTEQEVMASVREALNCLGGLENFVQPGQTVALKPNLVMKKAPQEAVTTHPQILRAVAQEVLRVGGIPLICESPGGLFTAKSLASIYQVSGMSEAAEQSGAKLNFDVSEKNCPHPEGEIVKSLPIIKALAEADLIINLPKLKTHSMTTYSGAVKNLYGAIPGMKKAEFHFKMPEYQDFANLLVDINTLLKPVLHIMDAIVGMEGDGPTAGSPKQVGLIMASDNAFDLDSICIRLIGLSENAVPTQLAGHSRGLVQPLRNIELRGEFKADNLPNFRFRPPKSRQINFVHNYLPRFIADQLSGFLKPRLTFSPELCVGCGVCAQHCPAKAIELKEHQPKIQESTCIRCFCCQELCPHKAVIVEKSWLAKLLFSH